ncbi:nucleotidyltransferase domain-containing protein [Streptomyces sp. NPDC051561]|uniref:nucleotidyltransferase domain-containing protein n=1 Tax=Streptomyces sp. NPDC051561 TaxID=3365658 RepID=UPI0037911D8B
MDPIPRTHLKELGIEDVLKQFTADREPAAVGVQGSFVRGTFDVHSDVDLVLLYPQADQAPDVQPHRFHDLQERTWSIWRLNLDRVDPAQWSEAQRYCYGHETLAYRDPSGKLDALCGQARFTDRQVHERVAWCVGKIVNRRFYHLDDHGPAFHGMESGLPDITEARGDFVSAHQWINDTVGLLVNLVFAVNGRPTPSPKSRIRIMRALPWYPPALGTSLERLTLVRAHTGQDYRRRKRLLRLMLGLLCDEALQRGLLGDDLADLYHAALGPNTDDTIR